MRDDTPRDDTPTERFAEGFGTTGDTPAGEQLPPTVRMPASSAPASDTPGAAEPPTERMPTAGEPADPAPHVPLLDPTPEPTVAYAAPVPTAVTATGETAAPDSQRRFLIALSVIGGLLLIAVIALLLVLFLPRGDSEPAPADTPTPRATETAPVETPEPQPSETEPAPEPTPTETVPPAPPSSAIGDFLVDTTSVDCSNAGSVPVTFVWVADGTRAWFGVGTRDASAQPYEMVPLEAEYPFEYQCGQASGEQIYTLTVQTVDGEKEHATITIRES